MNFRQILKNKLKNKNIEAINSGTLENGRKTYEILYVKNPSISFTKNEIPSQEFSR